MRSRTWLATSMVTVAAEPGPCAGCGRDPGCSLFGRDIRAFWAQLLARAERGELGPPGVPGYRFDAFELIDFTLLFLSGPDWRDLADILIAIDTGTEGLRIRRAGNQEVLPNPLPAVFCEDWNLPVRNYVAYATHLAVQRAIAPDMRYYPSALYATVSYLGWPSTVNNPQPPTRDGGHGVYGRGPCVQSIIHDHLFTEVAPAPGTRCPAFEPEFPAATNRSTAPVAQAWMATTPANSRTFG